jgi:hypothetical protein
VGDPWWLTALIGRSVDGAMACAIGMIPEPGQNAAEKCFSRKGQRIVNNDVSGWTALALGAVRG